MWINDHYYNELVKVLIGFSENRVDFDAQRFESFQNEKYNKLTNLLKDITANTKAHINTNIKIMTSLEDGSYAKIDETTIKDNDFKIFYEKYNLLVNHHDRISRHILRVQHSITEKGKIDSRLDVDEVRGKWFDVIANVNLILSPYLLRLKKLLQLLIALPLAS